MNRNPFRNPIAGDVFLWGTGAKERVVMVDSGCIQTRNLSPYAQATDLVEPLGTWQMRALANAHHNSLTGDPMLQCVEMAS
jgi:hypothetical protein